MKGCHVPGGRNSLLWKRHFRRTCRRWRGWVRVIRRRRNAVARRLPEVCAGQLALRRHAIFPAFMVEAWDRGAWASPRLTPAFCSSTTANRKTQKDVLTRPAVARERLPRGAGDQKPLQASLGLQVERRGVPECFAMALTLDDLRLLPGKGSEDGRRCGRGVIARIKAAHSCSARRCSLWL